MKKILALGAITLFSLSSCQNQKANAIQQQSEYIKEYKGDYLNRIAFPIGGMGAGMFCLEGTGAISNMSVRHQPNIFNEPCMFAAVHVKGYENGSKVLEGPVPDRKKFGGPESALGGPLTSWGLPRFENVSFSSRFPFATVRLSDKDVPLDVGLYRWHILDPVRFDKDLKVTIQDLGWRHDGRYNNQKSDISSTTFWYQAEPHAKFPALPSKDGLEIPRW
ncbi:DUF2961 domain-containing protein [Bacteroides uniformis]|uniref:DUF2961 domain-containing protein n=1 Tax=Bacteroides uniformis TaxID=820 RepID=UPI0021D2F514|nr:DUF2961 domain-containing protein [Bacteroides uniformis]